ncbi:MAG: ankyrin repeat domain-containing protein [Rhodoferax sp.]|nr:ankyrin repeat domain-containing protein [Rhodoferax sp.]MCF8207884.1 ankyrin repeat domain-containing protein [Rhodoferax sp.]
MKHPFLASLGNYYPVYLEQHHGHVLRKIEEIWDSPELEDYLSDLLLDKRGGRKGFSPEATKEIVGVRDFRALETLRAAERKESAIQQLGQRGLYLKRENFLEALEDGDQELMDLFVRAHFNIHILDDQGTPPLLVALKKGYTIVAKILLAAGADVNEKDRLGLTPLMLACGKPTAGYKEVAEALIKKGAHINVRDALGYTPLLLALSGGTVEVAELLIEKGADLSARTRQGDTPLSLARKANYVAIMERLLDKGATQ